MIFTKKNMFFILFIAVFVACCVFSNKVFAEEETLNWQVVEHMSYSNGVTIAQNSRHLIYTNTDSNYVYTITNNSSTRITITFSSQAPTEAGVPITLLGQIESGSSLSFAGDSNYYLSSISNDLDDSNFILTRTLINGYDNTINNLTQAISLDNLWSQFGVGLIALAVLFALGFLVVRKVLKKDSNYKG